jgi:hypothetical protein
VVVLIGASFVANPNKLSTLKALEPPVYKNTGGFYTGVYMPEVQATGRLQPVAGLEAAAGHDFKLVSLYQAWGPASVDSFPQALLEDIYRKNAVPMITWEPWTNTFPELAGHPSWAQPQGAQGHHRRRVRRLPESVRRQDPGPAPAGLPAVRPRIRQPGLPLVAGRRQYAPGIHCGLAPRGELFMAEGVSNVAWVWNPWRDTVMYDYFPGGLYVDWLGVTCLNYGTASADGKWRSYEEIYAPYRQKLLDLQKPVMLAEFGSTAYGGDPVQWTRPGPGNHREKAPGNQGRPCFSTAARTRTGQPNGGRLPALNSSTGACSSRPGWRLVCGNSARRRPTASALPQPYNAPPVPPGGTGSPSPAWRWPARLGKYELLVDGKPFYVRGVAYNTAHDWRDGHFPLTRKQIEQDLRDIKSMGANTIRRYNPGVYDRNILTVAREQDLKVWYGFWFDPEVDYYRDSAKVAEYLNGWKKPCWRTGTIRASVLVGGQRNLGPAQTPVPPALPDGGAERLRRHDRTDGPAHSRTRPQPAGIHFVRARPATTRRTGFFHENALPSTLSGSTRTTWSRSAT